MKIDISDFILIIQLIIGEKHSSKPMMNPNQNLHGTQNLVSSQQMQSGQRVANNHGQGGQPVQMDAYGRPVHNPSKAPSSGGSQSATSGAMHPRSSQGQQQALQQGLHQGVQGSNPRQA